MRCRIEIAVLVAVAFVFGMPSMVCATLINSNSIIEYDIEYYIQTDKSVYGLGEDVEMLYRVTNVGEGDATFWFGGSPEWNFWVEKDGQHIWKAVNGWYLDITQFTLSPGGYKEYPYIWDMRDDEDILVSAGEYSVIGGFDAGAAENYEYSKVSVGVEIVPEPTSITLLTVGLFGVILNRKRKS